MRLSSLREQDVTALQRQLRPPPLDGDDDDELRFHRAADLAQQVLHPPTELGLSSRVALPAHPLLLPPLLAQLLELLLRQLGALGLLRLCRRCCGLLLGRCGDGWWSLALAFGRAGRGVRGGLGGKGLARARRGGFGFG